MLIGVAEARRRIRELLELVESGETVEISRRGHVVARLSPVSVPAPRGADPISAWRSRWDVDQWPEDDDPFADVREQDPGRDAPW